MPCNSRYQHVPYGYLLLVILTLDAVRASLYDRTSFGLTAFPHDFPSDTDEVILRDNNIATVDYLEPLPLLTSLNIRDNLLTDFPDLFNVSTTLDTLYLSNNQISSIDPPLLSQLTKLKFLYLMNNDLTGIPDVSGPRLRKLRMDGNPITEFPLLQNLGPKLEDLLLSLDDPDNGFTNFTVDHIKALPSLSRLDLRGNQLTRWVDFCQASWTTTLQLQLSSTKYHCDRGMLLAVLAYATGRVVFPVESPVCVSGSPALVGVDWADVTLELFLEGAGDNTKHHYIRLNDAAKFYCYPAIRSRVVGVSLTKCAALCAVEHDCAMFAYSEAVCSTTSMSAGTESEFRSAGDNWYILDTRS